MATGILSGVAAREQQIFYPSGVYGAGIELAPGTLADAVDANPSIDLLMSHSGWPLASTQNGTLDLSVTSGALLYEAELDLDQSDALLAYQKVESGMMTESSFGFWIVKADWITRDSVDVLLVSEIDLDGGDVSVVKYGGNRDTSVDVESRTSMEEQCQTKNPNGISNSASRQHLKGALSLLGVRGEK